MGDPRIEPRFTSSEIAKVLGITPAAVCSRRKKRGIPVNPNGYTLTEVKKIAKKKNYSKRLDPKKVEALKTMLKNDGVL